MTICAKHSDIHKQIVRHAELGLRDILKIPHVWGLGNIEPRSSVGNQVTPTRVQEMPSLIEERSSGGARVVFETKLTRVRRAVAHTLNGTAHRQRG